MFRSSRSFSCSCLWFLFPLMLLVSCARTPLYLQFHTEDSKIRQQFAVAVDACNKSPNAKIKIVIWDDSKGNPSADLPVLHVGFRATVPDADSVPGLKSLPSGWETGAKWETGPIFKNWARGESPSWKSVPLFWNGWGVSAFLSDKTFFPTPHKNENDFVEWNNLPVSLGKKYRLLMPGSSVAGRQVFFACIGSNSLNDQRYADLISAKEKNESVKDVFKYYAEAGSLKFLSPDTLNYSRKDFVNTQKPDANLIFLESFQDYFLDKGAQTRLFKPLIAMRKDSSYALVGTVLTAYLTGKNVASFSKDFLNLVISADFQKSFSLATGLMPCNFQAPVLDEVNMDMRNALIGSSALLGVNPEPDAEPAVKKHSEILDAIRKAPAQWDLLRAE